MKYTENDITEGTKLSCTKANPEWWTVGKLYDVTLNEEHSVLQITDDDGNPVFTSYLLDCLNGNYEPVSFEIVGEEKEMTNYVEVTKLIDWSRDPELLEVGKVYRVVEEYKDMLYIKGVSIYVNEREESYYLRSDQFKYVEKNEEEKEMTKYAKITKYDGLGTDEEVGLEIGKTYEIVSFEDEYTNDCRIYINEEHPHYFISEYQYELVEKEYPVATFKVDTLEVIQAKLEQLANEVIQAKIEQLEKEYPVATFKVDVKEVIQAKIDKLRTDAEIIANKRKRLEQQAINLNAKARKLEEVIETIKGFE